MIENKNVEIHCLASHYDRHFKHQKRRSNSAEHKNKLLLN